MSTPALDQLWEYIPFPILIVGEGDLVTLSNPAAEQFLHVSSKQLLTKPISKYFGETSVPMELVKKARREKGSFTRYDIEIITGPSKAAPCDVHVVHLDEPENDILILVQPLTVAQQMRKSVNHLNAANSVGALASTLAHEIRNPLAGIIGAAQLLEMNASSDDSKLTDLIAKEARRIGTLVDQVDLFGDDRPIIKQAVNIHTILDRAIASAKAGYGRNAQFLVEFDPSLPDAAGDGDALLQVFQNLLKNAAEAVDGKHAKIWIRTSYSAGVKYAAIGDHSEKLPLRIDIEDNGGGISDEMLKNIFEPFVSTKTAGKGLGLPLVSKIIAGHGGMIEHNRSHERTRFSVLLPIWRSEKERA